MDFSTPDGSPDAGALALTDKVRIWRSGGWYTGLLSAIATLLFGKAQTTTATISLPAGTTAKAPLNIPAGAAPTSPVAGDIWVEGTALKYRIGSTTYTVTAT